MEFFGLNTVFRVFICEKKNIKRIILTGEKFAKLIEKLSSAGDCLTLRSALVL